MELRDVFAGNWRLLIVVPAITAIVSVGLFSSSSEDSYEATAVVSVTEFVPTGNAASVRASIDDFDGALDSQAVSRAVAVVAPSAETFRVASQSIGDGGEVAVAFEAATADEAEAGLNTGVRTALILVSESTGRQIERRLVAADAVALGEEATLQDIESVVGVADLEAELNRRSGDLLVLRNQIASAVGNGILQNSLESTFEEKRAELDEIEKLLLPWTRARVRFEQAVDSGAEAALSLREIEESQNDLQSDDLLQSLRVSQSSNVLDLLRAVVPATVVTAGAVVLIVLFLGSKRRPLIRRDGESTATGLDASHVVDDDDWWDAELVGRDPQGERAAEREWEAKDRFDFDHDDQDDDPEVFDDDDDDDDGDGDGDEDAAAHDEAEDQVEFDDDEVEDNGDDIDDDHADDDLTNDEAHSNKDHRVGSTRRRR